MKPEITVRMTVSDAWNVVEALETSARLYKRDALERDWKYQQALRCEALANDLRETLAQWART